MSRPPSTTPEKTIYCWKRLFLPKYFNSIQFADAEEDGDKFQLPNIILNSSKQNQENEEEWSDGYSDGDEEDFIEFRLSKKGPNSSSNNK